MQIHSGCGHGRVVRPVGFARPTRNTSRQVVCAAAHAPCLARVREKGGGPLRGLRVAGRWGRAARSLRHLPTLSDHLFHSGLAIVYLRILAIDYTVRLRTSDPTSRPGPGGGQIPSVLSGRGARAVRLRASDPTSHPGPGGAQTPSVLPGRGGPCGRGHLPAWFPPLVGTPFLLLPQRR